MKSPVYLSYFKWLVALILCWASAASGQDALQPVLLGSWPGFARGQGEAVKVSGHHAFVAAGLGGLSILDISDPANPKRVGGWKASGWVPDVAVADQYAYIIDVQFGLRILDVAEPSHPVLIGEFFQSSPQAVFVAGSRAYIVCFSGLVIVDVSNPRQPVFEAEYTGRFPFVEAITVSGGRAYVSAAYEGLKIIDVSTTNLTLVGEYDTDDWVKEVQVIGQRAYVADLAGGLKVFDVSQPTNIVLLGPHSVRTVSALGVQIVSNFAYVATCCNGDLMQVFDISNPTNITSVSSYNAVGTAQGVSIAGEVGCVVNQDGEVHVFAVNYHGTPSPLGTGSIGGYSDDVYIAGDYAYVADRYRGLQIINVEDPANPIHLGRAPTTELAVSVKVAGNYAYVACDFGGLQIFDISNKTNPVRVGQHRPGGQSWDLEIVGSRAYLANSYSGLQILDISDPANPVWLGGYGTNNNALSVEVAGDFACLAHLGNPGEGFVIVDVRDPANPVRVGGLSDFHYGIDIAIRGHYAYVTDQYQGLFIIDISSPANPQIKGRLNTYDYSLAIDISGSWGYLSKPNRLEVIDMHDPINLAVVSTLTTLGNPSGVTAVGDRLYVANGSLGLEIFRFDFPPRLYIQRQSGGSVILEVETAPGQPFTIDRTTNLSSSASWVSILSTNVNSAAFNFTDTISSGASSLYRVRRP